MKIVIAFFLSCVLANCAHGKLGWTDITTKDVWRSLPNNIDQCMAMLDTILSEKAKFHFKNTEESIAVIQISRELGPTFIGAWNLRETGTFYNGPKKKLDVWTQVHGLSTNSNISYYLNQYGINDPIEMLRIIFTCYHKKLVNNFFDLTEIANTYKSYWIKSRFVTLPGTGSPTPNLWELNTKMEKRDDSLVNKYFFDRVKVSDTLTTFLFYEKHRFTGKPLSYSIEALVVNKDSISSIVKSKIILISNRKNSPEWYDNKTKREVGDIIETGADRWNIKGESSIYYR